MTKLRIPCINRQYQPRVLGGFFLIGGVILFFDRAMYVAHLGRSHRRPSNRSSGWPWAMYAARGSFHIFANPDEISRSFSSLA